MSWHAFGLFQIANFNNLLTETAPVVIETPHVGRHFRNEFNNRSVLQQKVTSLVLYACKPLPSPPRRSRHRIAHCRHSGLRLVTGKRSYVTPPPDLADPTFIASDCRVLSFIALQCLASVRMPNNPEYSCMKIDSANKQRQTLFTTVLKLSKRGTIVK